MTRLVVEARVPCCEVLPVSARGAFRMSGFAAGAMNWVGKNCEGHPMRIGTEGSKGRKLGSIDG
jgi:hypothetical protein